jgi:hypothetical protein
MSDPEQAIIFTVGRMNPPTSGHMKVIQKMLEKALVLGQRNVYILLSHTTGEQKNPLKCSEKKEFLSSGMIDKVKQSLGAEHIEVTLICGDEEVSEECEANWITGKLCNIMLMNKYDKGRMIHLYLFIGSDRESAYDTLLVAKYNKPDALTHITIITEGLERPPGAMSASDMRLLVTEGKQEDFIAKEMEAGLSRAKAAELYSKLAHYLSYLPEKKIKPTATKSTAAKSTATKSTATKSTATKSASKRTQKASGGRKRTKKYKKRKTRKYKKYNKY